MMRKLYTKIFLSFWLSSSLIIISTLWLTGVGSRQSYIPTSQKVILNNYAHAAIATYESGKEKALKRWLQHILEQKKLSFYLISHEQIFALDPSTPKFIKILQNKYHNGELQSGLTQNTHYLVSNEILTSKGNAYRLISINNTPVHHQLLVPWRNVLSEMIFAIFLSGSICYFLSHYLTKPLNNLRNAARKISYGELKIHLDPSLLKRKDEIGDLSQEFNNMAQRIDKLNSIKERLLQDISHELRSPLARLQIGIALCQKTVGDACQEDFERMELEISRLDLLIGEILSLAKLQDPNKKLMLTKVNITEMVKTLIEDAYYEYKQKDINIKFNCNDAYVAIVDEILIHSALENIMRNALRYSKNNSELIITLNKIKGEIIYQVLDHGPGVPEEDLKAIFNPFYRVDSSRTTSTGGYGIGLALTKKSIELHQGSIIAKNIKPHGLKVILRFPASINNSQK